MQKLFSISQFVPILFSENVKCGQIKIETYCFPSKGGQINLNIFANRISSNKGKDDKEG